MPTRELAAQVGEVLRRLAQPLADSPRLKVAVVFGGVSINPQMMALRGGADVVVATPGRLLDLVEHNALRLTSVEMLVLDEADRLLDLGFTEELHRVLWLVPPQRQSLFFSATFPPAVRSLADGLLRDPLRLDVPATPANEPAIAQRAIRVDEKRRTELLRHLITENDWERVLVFVATRYAAQHVAWKLHQAGIFASPFHGEMSQGARQQVLTEFKNGQWDVLVTTDLASRGIDIEQLQVVVNYDLPRSRRRLRSPHRPHRPRRRQRAGGELRDSGRRGAFPADRKAPGPEPAARAGAGLRTDRVRGGGCSGNKRAGRHRRHQGQAPEQEGQVARRGSANKDLEIGLAGCVGCRPFGPIRVGAAAGRLGLAMTGLGQDLDVATRRAFLHRRVDRGNQAVQVHRLGAVRREAEAAVEIQEIDTCRQFTPALALHVLADLVLDRVHDPVAVLAFDGELECLFHA